MPRPAVYKELAERIRTGLDPYEDSWEIPSVRSLARQYSTSVNTVLRALEVLTEQGQVLRRGVGRRYVRHRPAETASFCKPYPAVVLIAPVTIKLGSHDYLDLLLGGFVSVLVRHVPVTISRLARNFSVRPIPGGVTVGPSTFRASAVALHSGAPNVLLAELVAGNAIVMTLDSLSSVEGVDCVAVDCEREAEVAAQYLHRLGHRHIGYIAERWYGPPPHWTERVDPDCKRFERALLAAKQRLGLNASDRYHVVCEIDPGQTEGPAQAVAARLWRLDPPPTAVICFNRIVAEQLRAVLARRGLRCPADVSILTRDFSKGEPGFFTTLASDPDRIGTSAAEHMVSRLTDRHVAPSHLLIRSALVEGRSTGPAPR